MSDKENNKAINADWQPSVSVKNNGTFIVVDSYCGLGLSMIDPSVKSEILIIDVSDNILGEVIIKYLEKSRLLTLDESVGLRLNISQNYRNWVENLIILSGYKSKKNLFNKMKSCTVNLDGSFIIIEPSCHEKLEAWSGRGITENDYVKIPENSTPAEVGAALRLAFSRCTGMGT